MCVIFNILHAVDQKTLNASQPAIISVNEFEFGSKKTTFKLILKILVQPNRTILRYT